jgi:predicted Zn-dependent protease
MTSSTLANLLKLVGTARDGALLRFSLGNEYLKSGQPEQAVLQFQAAVERDSGYSAAWKLLGKSLRELGRKNEALQAWRSGIAAAEAKGDKQAGKEMAVFVKRLEKELSADRGVD